MTKCRRPLARRTSLSQNGSFLSLFCNFPQMAFYQLFAMNAWLPLSSPCVCVLYIMRRSVLYAIYLPLWRFESMCLSVTCPAHRPFSNASGVIFFYSPIVHRIPGMKKKAISFVSMTWRMIKRVSITLLILRRHIFCINYGVGCCFELYYSARVICAAHRGSLLSSNRSKNKERANRYKEAYS